MDAKFSDAHTLDHKRIVHPKLLFFIGNPEPIPGHRRLKKGHRL